MQSELIQPRTLETGREGQKQDARRNAMNMTSGRHTKREAYERFYVVVVRINKNKPPMKCTSLAVLVPIDNRRRASLLHYTDDSFL